MPEGFTASLAERLNRLCAIEVKEACDGERIRTGTAYIGPAGRHLTIVRSGSTLKISLTNAPADTLHRPSVDVLFASAAAVCGGKTLAVVLTGMGKDGSVGARPLKTAGARLLVESEETSIVFGMPKAAMESTSVDGVVPLYDMADKILKMI
jgi:two-component system chemotaxis response regulator CheB